MSAASLASLREAVHWRAPQPGSATRVEARVRHLDGPGSAVIAAAAGGAMLLRIDAPLPQVYWAGTEGGDGGEDARASDWTGMPYPLEGQDLESARFLSSILTGVWLSDGSALEVGRGEPGDSSIPIQVRGGLLAGRALLDPDSSGRPAAFEFESLGGTERLDVTWGDPDLPWVPTRLRHTVEGVAMTDFERVAAVVGEPATVGLSAPGFPEPDDFSFSAADGDGIRAERAPSGHVLVETEVDGTRGWFILDTGAAVTVLAAGWRNDLPIVGRSPLASAYGFMAAPVRRAATLSIGPLTVRGLPAVEMDLDFLAEPLGRPIHGIVGYDVLSRCVATVESAVPRVTFAAHPPSSPALWIPLRFESKLPIVPGRWDGGHSGLFRIDLGAGPAVIFFWPTVERLRLLEGREGPRIPAGTETLLMSSIEWLEIAGRRVPDVVAFFTENPSRALFRDRATDGNVGLGFLDFFKLTLDYRRARFALVPREEPAPIE